MSKEKNLAELSKVLLMKLAAKNRENKKALTLDFYSGKVKDHEAHFTKGKLLSFELGRLKRAMAKKDK